MTKSIAVVGGTGFLGSRICREAALRGMNVVSLSRSAPSASLLAHHWAEKVEWRAADVLAPPVDGQAPEWKSLLEGRDAVVHCVGQLLADASYKDALRRGDTAKLAGIAVSGARDIAMGVAGAAMSVAGGLASAVAGRPSGSGSFGSSRTSFASGSTSWGSSSFSSSSTGPGSIYAANRDSALASANAAAEANVGQFIFVSAAELFPFQTDYVKSKRQAERMLLDPSAYGFSSVIMRPGISATF